MRNLGVSPSRWNRLRERGVCGGRGSRVGKSKGISRRNSKAMRRTKSWWFAENLASKQLRTRRKQRQESTGVEKKTSTAWWISESQVTMVRDCCPLNVHPDRLRKAVRWPTDVIKSSSSTTRPNRTFVSKMDGSKPHLRPNDASVAPLARVFATVRWPVALLEG